MNCECNGRQNSAIICGINPAFALEVNSSALSIYWRDGVRNYKKEIFERKLMPSTSIVCGILLVLIGVIGYVNGVITGHASFTALIPAIFGAVLIILGVLARAKEDLRKHLMHAAVVIALLGFIMTAGRLVSKLSELTYSAAVVSQVSMALVCLLFVILGIKSFGDARRSRRAEG